MLKLQPENTIVDIPDLNRFQIGDHVIIYASAENDRFEGVIIGIELQRLYGSEYLVPSITLLHDGYVTDGFKPADCRKVTPDANPRSEGIEADAWMDEFGEVSTTRPAINPKPLYLHPPAASETQSIGYMDTEGLRTLVDEVKARPTDPQTLQVPKGYALVPVKPTKAMVRAAINIQGVWPAEAKAAWKAMVKAATLEGPNHG